MVEESSLISRIDFRLRTTMQTVALPVLRYSLAVIFIWFGILKPFGQSPATELAAQTVPWIPREIFIPVLGFWEVAIGVCFLFRRLVRVAMPLLALQISGTFLPLVLLPKFCFTQPPFGLTIEGQYIVKNLLIIGSALAVGGSLPPIGRRKGRRDSDVDESRPTAGSPGFRGSRRRVTEPEFRIPPGTGRPGGRRGADDRPGQISEPWGPAAEHRGDSEFQAGCSVVRLAFAACAWKGCCSFAL